MKLIIGLGNPGQKYEQTRHNIGFAVIDVLAERMGVRVNVNRGRGLTAQGMLGGEKVMLAKPLTYMNLSGEFVGPLAAYYKLPPEDVIVVCDDINLPPGQLRLRGRGSAGGHNGLKSLIAHLGSEDFPRVRCGVGVKPPEMDLADFVLAHFSSAEQKLFSAEAEKAADAVTLLLEQGLSAAMNEYNKKADEHGEEL